MQHVDPDVSEWRNRCQQANDPVVSITAEISSVHACCRVVLTQTRTRSDDMMQRDQ